MNRTDFFNLIQPLTPKLYRAGFCLMPDDLQVEQLVIDAFNGYLIREKKNILNSKELNQISKKDLQVQRRIHFKGILKNLAEIGVRRSLQLSHQMGHSEPHDFKPFFKLDPRVRLTLCLRYDFQFTTNEIEDITGMTRYEVIEKLHNGRYLLLHDVNQGALV
jgi:hypothetical protein